MNTDIENGLQEIWAHLLKLSPIGADDDFFDLGGTSLQGVEMIMEIERRFGTELPVSILANPVTITRLVALINGASETASTPATGWGLPTAPGYSRMLVPLKSEGTKTPLFVVHGVGLPRLGGSFAENLDPDQPAYVFHPRGIDGKGGLSRTIEDMAADYVQAMAEVQPAGPYFIGSVCAGAYIALEMAHQLSTRGEQVPMLILVDPPTSLHAVGRPWYHPWYAMRLAGFLQRSATRLVSREHKRQDIRVRRHIQIRGQISTLASADENTRIDRAVEAQNVFVRALRKYRPNRYHGIIHLVCAAGPRDPHRRAKEIWSRAHDDVQLQVIGETHTDLLHDRLADLARYTQRCLDAFAPAGPDDSARPTVS